MKNLKKKDSRKSVKISKNKKEKGITLIALVITIIVLLILVGISIAMLTGNNGVLTKATEAKEKNEIGKEKEYITLSVSAIKGDKMSKGDASEITSNELQTEIDKYTDEAIVSGNGTLIVTYESGREYEVTQEGNIIEKEELTPEESKKIVDVMFFENGVIFQIADETVYYVENIDTENLQNIKIEDGKIITQNGIKCKGDNAFIDNEGKVYTWGNNSSGQLGDGTNEYSSVPICISDIPGNALNGKNISNIKGYSTMTAIDKDGKVYMWGNNSYGQLGNGTNENSNIPICISDIPGNALNGKNIMQIQNGRYGIIAIDKEGKVYTWGDNNYGQLGNGTTEDSNEPICISDILGNALNGKKVIGIEMQYNNRETIAIDNEGKVYTWGYNLFGQLGNGTDENSNIPICISDILGNVLNGKKVIEIQCSNTMIAIDDKGKLYVWGYNDYGQLGNGTTEDSNIPICISDIPGNALNGKKVIEMQSGDTMVALDDEGKLYTWGSNYFGQLGNGTNENSSVPISISDIPGSVLNGKRIIEIQTGSTMVVLDAEGKLYAWGDNRYGQLLNGITEDSNEPICITDNRKSELYNKKIMKYISTYMYITQDGELYVYIYINAV